MPAYRAVTVRVPGWKLLTKTPRILVAQVVARFVAPSQPNGRIRLVHDADYRRRLRSAVDQMKVRNARFLLFPEYSWPFEGYVDSIQYVSSALPKMSACVMPFEHLSFNEFRRLLTALPIEAAHSAHRDHPVRAIVIADSGAS